MLWKVLCWTTSLFPQVNGITLLGENHQDVVNILKELPIEVTMVCCRRTVPPTTQSELDGLDLCDIELTEKVLDNGYETNLNILYNGKDKWCWKLFLGLFSFIWCLVSLYCAMAYKDRPRSQTDLALNQAWHFLALGPWASHFTFLNLSFFLCAM